MEANQQRPSRTRIAVRVAALVMLAPTPPAFAQAANLAKQEERRQEWSTQAYQKRLNRQSGENFERAQRMLLEDPERNFGTDVCWSKSSACAGDVRLYDWGPERYGLVEPVLFANRSGATISGHVWATRAGRGGGPRS